MVGLLWEYERGEVELDNWSDMRVVGVQVGIG